MVTLKSSEQIKHIGEACRLTAQLLDLLADFIEEGMTTHEIDRYCFDFITKSGGKPAFLNYMGFPASACISINEEVIHGIPGSRKVKEGDLVSVDLGINLNGYYSDAARTYIVGKTNREWEKLVSVTHQCLLEGIEGAKKQGARIHDISMPIFTLANSHGFGVVRDYCGHGVGLSLHEDPQIPNYVNPFGANMRLRVGMVLAIEPMINLGTKNVRVLDDGWTVVTTDGKPSAHWEHTVAVTENGIEILTLAQ